MKMLEEIVIEYGYETSIDLDVDYRNLENLKNLSIRSIPQSNQI